MAIIWFEWPTFAVSAAMTSATIWSCAACTLRFVSNWEPRTRTSPAGEPRWWRVNVVRVDGFDSAIEVNAESLPTGITATPAMIDRGELSGMLALSADATAPAFSTPTWRVVARPLGDRSSGSAQVQEIDPGGPAGGWITVTPRPNLNVTARPNRVVIHPGEQVSMTLAVERGPAFRGRVPIDVKNLPQGVRVLNIGLNGVLITEAQVRTDRVFAGGTVGPIGGPAVLRGRQSRIGGHRAQLFTHRAGRRAGPQDGTGIKKP